VLEGTRGEIEKLQKFLNWAISSKLEIDGKYGEKTEDAVDIFQSKCKLKIDGKFGKKSLKAAKLFSK
jgi:peptidoglycan hydrolase-like protein with peptidoglycan-binding domain